ncbi:hypothetical protein [Herbaspirillum huttiense]|uniref:hypothetical protein n=1 Tax=Herbaspirillum huttiense TaxID=863372 RepID=UPI0023F36D5A|nr:hypothetical protein [Herbaspirillum huttiense]
MLIKRIDGSTRQLGAPADWDGKDMSCGVLPILDVQTPEGNFMFSAWEPTPPELEALNKGANILLGVRGTAHPVVSLQVAADADVKHPDDVAVDQFAEAMKAKLADARAKGRSGWQDCDPAELSYMLREHVEKGDPRDVANFCMFLWSLGKPIGDTVLPISGRALPSPQEGQAGPAGWRIDWPADHSASVGGVRFIGKDDPVAKDRLVSLGATAVPLYASQFALPAGPFQDCVQPWMMACFGATISNDLVERNHRFLEEALELVQSTGCTQSEAHQLVDYVFGRPVGEPVQEVGGVMVTLAALCLAAKMDMHAAGETELARIWTKVEQIRAKQAAKPKHSPLPIAQPSPAVAQPGGSDE